MTHISDADEIPAEFGPLYPVLPLAVHRKLAATEAGQTLEARRAYGRAVHEAILAKQRAELIGPEKPAFKANCASGTFQNSNIGKAIRAQLAAKFARDVAADRKARSDEAIIAQYHAHMAKQRALTA